MENLTADIQSISSLEVAEMVGKKHNELLKDIRRYVKQLGEGKIPHTDFFSESSYVTDQNRKVPCYLVTKKGCEFIAHKMTGTKGTVFTARYINRFHDMENGKKNAEKLEKPKDPLPLPMPRRQSNTPIPRRLEWYRQSWGRMDRICKNNNVSRKELYRIILSALDQTYDMNEANEIYKRERGFYPKYAMDVVAYFSELAEDVNAMLECLDEN